MTEAEARAICTSGDLQKYTREECAEADRWVRDYALQRLGLYTRGHGSTVHDYLLSMARSTYGSAETDEFLAAMRCYPDWL